MDSPSHEHSADDQSVEAQRLEAAKAVLDAARRDFEEETDRMRVLDLKLTNLAAFSGVSISITSALGGSVVAAGKLPLGFQLALGAVLTVAAVCLLWGVVVAFRGLKPKAVLGISVDAARGRLTTEYMDQKLPWVVAKLAASSVAALERSRKINGAKAAAATQAFWAVGLGFAVLLLAIPITVVGSVI